MQHKLPIHLDTEDTFILSLTARQCIILAVGLGISWVIFTDISDWLPTSLGVALGLVVGLAFFAGVIAPMAFLKIKTRGIEEWAIVWALYHIQPKHYSWNFNHQELIEIEEETDQPEITDTDMQENDQW